MKSLTHIIILLLLVSCNVQNSSKRSLDFIESNDFKNSPGQSQVAANAKSTIRSKCLGCHASFANLSTDQDFVRAGLIVAGFPDRSKIFLRVSGTSQGSRMPKNQRTLEDNEISDIRFWIEQI